MSALGWVDQMPQIYLTAKISCPIFHFLVVFITNKMIYEYILVKLVCSLMVELLKKDIEIFLNLVEEKYF